MSYKVEDYRVMLVTGAGSEDITGRTGTGFSFAVSEGHKGGGEFAVGVRNGDVIPRAGHIVEVWETRRNEGASATYEALAFYGMVNRVSRPSFARGDKEYRVSTGTPESMLANRIPFLITHGSVTEIVEELFNGWIYAESRHAIADIDGIDYEYGDFRNSEDTLYKVLDTLCERHGCVWNITIGEDSRTTFHFKKKGAGAVFSVDESTPGIADVTASGVSDMANVIRMDDGYVPVDTTARRVNFYWTPAADESGNPVNVTLIPIPAGEMLYSIDNVHISRPTSSSGSWVANMTEDSGQVKRLEEGGSADDGVLYYYTRGNTEGVRINPNFHGSIAGVVRTYAWLYLQTAASRQIYTYVDYRTCRKYARTVSRPNGMAEASEGMYTGIIERHESVGDASFPSFAEGDEYAYAELEYYAEPRFSVTMSADESFTARPALNDRVRLDFPHLDINAELIVTEIRTEPKLVNECPHIIRTYRLEAREPEPPAAMLSKGGEKDYNRDMEPYRESLVAEHSELSDSWSAAAVYEGLWDMAVAEASGTEGNNGQMAVPLDRPL